MVAVQTGREQDFAALAREHGVSAAAIGAVGGTSLTVADCFDIPLDELAAVHGGTLPALFG